jgi:cysteinyl-tRNA synthetase
MIANVALYNTLSRKLEPLKTVKSGEVSLYCCGPTVYNFQHIGNLKTYIFEDILARVLKRAGYKLTHVMNITDVGHLVSDGDEGEDKMLVAMKREGKSSHEIASYYTDIFFDDCKKLNIIRPDIVCKATDHIQEMIELNQMIEKNGYAYFANGNLYFDVEKFKEYGKLALLDLEKLKAGARIEVDPYKKSPFDFVLWFTNSKFDNQELQWDSPWGRGYPGWHIECSAMARKYLGDAIDIHCGGIDHIPVHHTNEIAQTEAATGKTPWVSVWMHSDFMVINKQKMSKSTGGFITLSDLIKDGISPESYRYFCLTASYRSQLNFSTDALKSAGDSVRKLKGTIERLFEEEVTAVDTDSRGYINKFNEALCNDLNTPQALAVLWAVIGDKDLSSAEKLGTLLNFDQVLGLGMSSWKTDSDNVPEEIQKLLQERINAKANKNFSESDRLRDEIQAKGFKVIDDKDGMRVKR